MKDMYATSHARKRMQQRAISQMQVRLIEMFGRYEYQKGGAHIAYMPEKTLVELRHAIDKLGERAIVVGESDKIVTVFHQNRRIHRTEYAA